MLCIHLQRRLHCDQISCVCSVLVFFASCISLFCVVHRSLLSCALCIHRERRLRCDQISFVCCVLVVRRSLLSCVFCIRLERRLRCDQGFVCTRRWSLLGCKWVSFVLYIGLFRVWYTSRKEAPLRSDCVCMFFVGFS